MSDNINNAEVKKFNALADEWWNLEGDFKTLHQINPIRLDYLVQQTGSLKDKIVLDVGCGGGILSESLAQAGAKVTAIDLAKDSIEVAKAHARDQGLTIDYRISSIEALAENHPAQYDVISCMELLEHVPDPCSMVKTCSALCKANGHIIFSTINRTPKAFALAIVGAEYLLHLIPAGTHEYAKFIRPSELANWARGAGLELVDISGLRFNPLTQQHALTKNTSVNYFLHCKKPE